MSSVNGLGGNSPVQKIISNPIYRSVSTDPSKPSSASDKVEISGMSHLLKALKNNDVRTEKVAAVKAEIEAGTYETDAKMDAAVDRMLDDLLK